MNIFIRLFLNCLGAKGLNSIKPGFSAFFYRKHLPDIVKEMSFWYMSKDNVKGRTPDEARALYQLLTDRKSKLISLAHESGAAVVPF